MTTEQIITNLLFMPGYREVTVGGVGARKKFCLGGDFGSFFEPDDGTLPIMSMLLSNSSNGSDYMTIRHWPERQGCSILYRFIPVQGEWVPLDQESVKCHLLEKKIKNCQAAVMEE